MYVFLKFSMAIAEAFHRAWTSACMMKNATNEGYDIVPEPEVLLERMNKVVQDFSAMADDGSPIVTEAVMTAVGNQMNLAVNTMLSGD